MPYVSSFFVKSSTSQTLFLKIRKPYFETTQKHVGMSEKTMNFDSLVAVSEQTHTHFQQQAVKAVNVSLTVRNYLIGFYIVEFEQNGEDRAAYGARLVDSLADSINTKGLGNRNLKLFRQFYLVYPEVAGVIKQFLETQSVSRIVQSATAQFQSIDNKNINLKPNDQFIQKLNHSKTGMSQKMQKRCKRT